MVVFVDGYKSYYFDEFSQVETNPEFSQHSFEVSLFDEARVVLVV